MARASGWRRTTPPRQAAMATIALAGLLWWATTISADATAEALPGPIPAQLVRVVAGDTVAIRAHVWLGQYIEVQVRLAGVEAPELGGACVRERRTAQRAQELIMRLLGSRPIQLKNIRTDKSGGGIEAQVIAANGTDLSAALLKAGLARPDQGARRAGWCS